jgi:hypothetical protein
MSRKQSHIHYIYKTTCNFTQKYYIGMHSTSNLEDGYMGSGKRLRYSIRKYGKDNHTKEILEFKLTRTELSIRESEIINKSLLDDELCMNLKEGGHGGGKFYSEEHMMKCSKAGNKAFSEKLKNDPEFKKKFSETKRQNLFDEISDGRRKPITEIDSCNWTGRKHKESSKKLVGEKNSITQKGEKNSQYGTYWVTKDNVNKKIKSEEIDLFIKNGWSRGRKTTINGELIKNSKLKENDVILIKQLISEGVLSISKIGNQFNVAPQTINKIKKGLTWSHIK